MRQFVGPVATDTAPGAIAHLTRKDYVDAGDAARQPLDGDLTTIAGLAPADGALMKRVSGAWAGSTLVAGDLPAATTSAQGAVVLAGDLGGTAALPRLVANTMVAKTAAYTVLDTDGIVLVTPTASTTITLPTAVGRTGKRFLIKKTFGAGFPVIIASAGGTIDGATTETIMVAGGFRELVSDGTNWYIVGGSVIPVINVPTGPANAGTLTVDANLATVFRLTPAVAGYTLAVPTSGVDGMQINFEFAPSVAFSLTINASILLTTGITTPIAVASGKKAFLGLRFSGSTWYVIASTVQV